MKSDTLVEQVRRHRRQWPLPRIGADPAGYRRECERLLAMMVERASADRKCDFGDTWLDLMFGDPAPATDHQEATRLSRAG